MEDRNTFPVTEIFILKADTNKPTLHGDISSNYTISSADINFKNLYVNKTQKELVQNTIDNMWYVNELE